MEKPWQDTKVRALKPEAVDGKEAEGGGLFLLAKTNGAKWWRFSDRFGGKQKTLSFGVYPAVDLKDAHEQRGEAKKLLANGIDSGAVRKAQKAARLVCGASRRKVRTLSPLPGHSLPPSEGEEGKRRRGREGHCANEGQWIAAGLRPSQ
jgi:hypothetical protein